MAGTGLKAGQKVLFRANDIPSSRERWEGVVKEVKGKNLVIESNGKTFTRLEVECVGVSI